MTHAPAVLVLDGVSKSHWRGPTEYRVLDNVSLNLEPGAIVGVQGRRGAGTTTLARIAAGLATPDSGRVLYDGVDLASMSPRQRDELRQRVAFVDRAAPALPDQTAREFVATPIYRTVRAREAHRRADAALESTGVAALASARWEELPDTGRSLVALAQALVIDPRVVVLDDPTAGALDVVDTERVMSVMRACAESGAAVLFIAPDIYGMAGHADRIGSLDAGELALSAPRAPENGGDPLAGRIVKFPDRRSA